MALTSLVFHDSFTFFAAPPFPPFAACFLPPPPPPLADGAGAGASAASAAAATGAAAGSSFASLACDMVLVFKL